MGKFTKEDAKAMSILDVAQSLGMELKQDFSQEWYWVEHDSFKINTRKNRFNWYSRDIHGDVIDLVETIKEVDYKQAMHYLRTGEFPKIELNQQPKEPFRYVLGRFEQPFIEARDYLKEVRGLSDDTINFFGQAGVLAQANKKAPDDYLEPVVVFKNLDKQGSIIGASLQGIVPNRERHEGKGYLKQIVYNSDGLSGMSVDIGTPRRLVFAEAPIDLMSYYEANKGNLSDVRLVAMDGLKPGTISRYTMELLAELQGKSDYKPDLNKVGEALEKLAKVSTFFQDGKNSDLITLAVDNDKAGRDFIERLQAKGIPVQPDLPPLPEGAAKMDWNDYLKSQKAGMVLEDSLPRDNSRLAQAARKLERLNGELVEKADKVYAHTRQANGQPMNDKRGGLSFFRKQDQLEGAVFTKLDEIKKQEERVDKLRYQRDLKERGFNKQGNGLIMSVDNIPRIKGAIEAFEKGEPGFTRATINRYRKELVKLEAMKEQLEDIRISPGAQHLIDEGLVTQWQKQPTLYFVKGLRKVALELTESGELQPTPKYLARDAEAVERVAELLEQQTTINNEKEQNMKLEHEPRFELEFSELGRVEQPLTNFDELQTWMLQQFNSVFVGEGYFKTYLQVYSLDEQGQEVASQIRFDVGHGQSDFNPRREHIRDYLVEHGYIQIDNSSLSMAEIEKEQPTSPLIQELLGQVEEMGQTAYFWVTEEDLGQSKEIVAQLDNWFSSGKVDSTYKSDIFELVAGDYTYMIESNDSQALFNHLKEGMKEYVNSDKYKQFLQAISKFHDYSIYNVHMMLLQKPDISLVASYRKWKTDFDRQVQKGEKGIKIWVPMTFKEKDKNGQPVLDVDGQEKTITRFKLGTVFDVSQTAGKEIPKPVYNLESAVPDYQNIYRAARHVSQENGVKISFQPIDFEANGYYHIEKNEIVIADKKMSEAQILKTLFHEMAHSELHHHNDGYSRSERELQAESIAYVVANHFGIDTSEYSFAYLHNWSLDKQGYEDLENQLKVVQAESKSLINRIDKSLELVKNKSLTTNKLQSKIAQAKQKQEQEKQLKSSEVKQEKSKKQQPTPKEL